MANDRSEKHFLLSIAALSFGLVGAPAAGKTSVEEAKAIDQLPAIRATVRETLSNGLDAAVAEKDPVKRAKLRGLIAQWNAWGNWWNG
jgi:hypothetical protein